MIGSVFDLRSVRTGGVPREGRAGVFDMTVDGVESRGWARLFIWLINASSSFVRTGLPGVSDTLLEPIDPGLSLADPTRAYRPFRNSRDAFS